ncbi:glycoside hydrolase [Gaoshiqia sediminis]|uniref:Cellulose-binding protein n=1 Tax=Gaoshiqia sediminis TaxID=2986998 RepID=A0AA41Y982_9BACT|nr:glycoside hydrolase [Gaoshiqia sediminis]MCW0483283.1 cellulose-binding protein [Gaoshiqia sediminis]
MIDSQKYLKWITLGIVLFLAACSKDSDEPLVLPASLSFVENTLPTDELSVDEGTVTFDVEWAHTKWTVKAGDAVAGQKFITKLSPALAGSTEEAKTRSTVSLRYWSNTTHTVNRQKLILSSTTENISDTIIISQAAKPVQPIKVTFDPNTTYQTISGFGGANMIWGTDYLTESELDLAFGTGDTGMGLSIYRVRLSSSKNDWEGLVNSVKGANQRGATVLASPWSPPAEWKSNNSTSGGGYLLPEHYADFANYINEFIQFMADRGATVDVVSIQNEPDWQVTYEGCEYTFTEMFNFVKNHAGTIQGAKVLAAESLNSNHAYTDLMMNDALANENLDIVGGHLYGSGLAKYPLAEQKGKEIWMTEHLLNLNSGNNPANWTENTDVTTIWNETMEMVKEIQTCMSYNWNAYIWWYIRRYYSFLGDGERGTSRGQILKRGYAMSQFSKFIRPGYVRIKTQIENSTTGLMITAFEGENEVVAVIVNPNSSAVPGVTLQAPSTGASAVAYTTSEFVNRKMEPLTAENDRFLLEVPANSVTTVVISN